MRSLGKKLLVLLLVLSTVAAMSACGGKTAAPPAPSENQDPAKETDVEDIGKELIVYTAEPSASMDILLEGWYKLYPDCEVDIVYGSAGEMTSRIKAEAAKPQADIMFSGINAGDGSSHEAIFEKYMSSHDNDLIEDCRNVNGYYNYVIISPSCFYVNKTLLEKQGITDPIKSYEDLLRPELKGLIVTSDPNSASAGWNNFCNILTGYGYEGEAAWDYIDKLMSNGLVITSSSSTVFTSVSNGEYAIGLTYEGGAANEIRNGVDDCEIIFPQEGNGYIITAAAIVKGCPHPEAAEAWVEFVTSSEGQGAWADGLGTTRVTNAKAKFSSPYLQEFDTINWKTRDIKWLTENKKSLLEKWNSIYNKYN